MLAACGLLLPGAAEAQDTVIAYEVPAGTAGNQAYDGPLGMEFDVINPITVTRLGAFDDNSDVIQLFLYVSLYNRVSGELLAISFFSPGADGELIGGSRFLDLDPPLPLEAGFQGMIVASGYGEGEREFNVLGDPDAAVWTLNDGNGSLRFVGSKWGTAAEEFPTNPDTGGVAAYAAGTFIYETTAPQVPGQPVIMTTPGNGSVTLTWDPVEQPLPAASYRVLRGPAADGPFAQLAEVNETTFLDTTAANGTVVWYVVRAVAGNGSVGPDSDPQAALPYALAENHHLAYLSPYGLPGNQAFGGSLGMDFDVQNPVIVKRLGVFDDNSDGMGLTITARLFDRDSEQELASMEFTSEAPGDPIGGMRFKALPSPIELPAGFHGVIAAEGYGAEERLLNSHGVLTAVVWTLDDGDGSILFVGSSRYGDAGAFPAGLDAGPAARYAAGTFEYEALPPEKPGATTLSAVLPAEDAAASLTWTAITQPLPAASYRILRSDSAEGPFTVVAEVSGTAYRDTGLANAVPVYYLVRGVGETGTEGLDSNIVRVVPMPRSPGVAYVNPAGTLVGNQAFNGSLGMDFDVARPIRITRLGVYDDGADGLFLPLTAAVYDRLTQTLLASLEFTPELPGDLVDSSRFKDLPEPLDLPAGFAGSMVAWGYGAEENLFNTGGRPADVALLGTFDGGSIVFVGTGRWGDAGAFPAGADGGPANRYAAGTFYFEPLEMEEALLSIVLSDGVVTLDWTGGGTLEGAPTATGSAWTPVEGASPGMQITPTEATQFFRVRQ
ncbi:MAG: hypothetical protein KDM81_08305 [Verrucomicrobiae bacterium]|nr:hypothetical protein [Verrucomicrobiae bacterium]